MSQKSVEMIAATGIWRRKCERTALMQSIHYHKTASKTGAHIQLSPSINAKAPYLLEINLKVHLCTIEQFGTEK